MPREHTIVNVLILFTKIFRILYIDIIIGNNDCMEVERHELFNDGKENWGNVYRM